MRQQQRLLAFLDLALRVFTLLVLAEGLEERIFFNALSYCQSSGS